MRRKLHNANRVGKGCDLKNKSEDYQDKLKGDADLLKKHCNESQKRTGRQ